MKRFISLACGALLLALTFTACGRSVAQQPPQSQPPESAQSADAAGSAPSATPVSADKQTPIVFPACKVDNPLGFSYIDAINRMTPFTVQADFPKGWSLTQTEPKGAESLPTGEFYTRYYIYNGQNLIGYIGFNTFELYTKDDVPPGDYYKTVYPYLRLSSMFQWDPYTAVKTTDTGETGIADIDYMEQSEIDKHPGAMPDVPQLHSIGVLAYDKALKVYIGIAFLPDTVDREQARVIAQSVTLAPSELKRTNLTFPAEKPDTPSSLPTDHTTNLTAPFAVQADFPRNWSLTQTKPEDAEALPPGEFHTPYYIYDGQTLIGSIGFNTFKPYAKESEVPPGNYYQTVYSDLRLSSTFQWNPYTAVKTTDTGETGIADINYKDPKEINKHKAMAEVPNLKGQGVLAYDKALKVYIGIAFLPGTVDRERAEAIAQSVTLAPPDFKQTALTFPTGKLDNPSNLPIYNTINHMTPFTARVDFPKGWSLSQAEPKNAAALPPGELYTPYYIYNENGQNLIGIIGFSPFDFDSPSDENEPPPGDYYKEVYAYLRNGSLFQWNPYTAVKTTDTGETGIADINYKDPKEINKHKAMAEVPNLKGQGVLAYDKALKVYVEIAFLPDRIDRGEAEVIAQSILLTR